MLSTGTPDGESLRGDMAWGLSLVDSPKFPLPEGTVSRPKLGLADSSYEKLRTSITYVIRIGGSLDYCYVYAMLTNTGGWIVEFGVGTDTFEKDIKGIGNPIELTISSSLLSPPHFSCTGSFAVPRSTYLLLRSSALAHRLFLQVTLVQY